MLRMGMATAVLILLSTAPAPADTDARPAGERLHALFDRAWEQWMQDSPTWATSLGDLRYNHLWPDLSPQTIEDRHRHRQTWLAELQAIPLEELSEADRVNYQLFERDLQTQIAGHQFRWHLLPVDQLSGIQDQSMLVESLPLATVRHYEDWIRRLQTFPEYMEQTVSLMREGYRQGLAHPRVVMQRIVPQIENQLVEDPRQSPLFEPFRRFPAGFSEQEQQRLMAEGVAAVREHVLPAYRKFYVFFTDEYLPRCPEEVGVWQFPNGEGLYAHRAAQYTTTELTPREIHEIGLNEIRRIRREMQAIIEEVGFDGTLQQFLEFLRTDPRFYYEDADTLLKVNRALCKRIDPELVHLFGKLPRLPYGVEPIPAQAAPSAPAAYYRPGAADGTRAGTYLVNTYRPETRPNYELTALALHEAVPGHHLHIALPMELDLPRFRRYGGYTAFVEGWALYAERLGHELGVYEDAYARFGQLTFEMWRAIRLVVDTGMHAFRWSRDDAIRLFEENTAKPRHEIETEIDRYIAWPGQALAYKIGELKIRELRRQAEEELGEQFNIRAFHDLVLGHGAVTLDVLETNVSDWIRETLAGPEADKQEREAQ